jgi:tetratricopeptide (TPR) repeat protein
MAEMTLEQVPPVTRDMFNRGFSAMERGNLDYAIAMFTACVLAEPTFHRARRFLRAAEIKQSKATKTSQIGQLVAMASTLPTAITAQILLSAGKPMQAIRAIEKLLRHDPLNLSHVRLLAKAAEAANEPEIAIQTLAMVLDHHPGNTEILENLGRLYMQTNQPRLGRDCFETLVELKPNDSAALKMLKDSMAIVSMTNDGWEETAATGGSFRRMIRDERKAEMLEREEKAVKGKDDIEMLIAENKARIQREPANVNYRRSLAQLYANNKMFEESIATLQDAQSVVGGRDPTIDQTISATRILAFDLEIAKLRESGMTTAAEIKEKDRATFIFNDLQDRITRYPNDLASKHDFGILLFQQNRINEAIQQFQASQRNAQRRINSIFHLGLCFEAKTQYDMAIEQLQKAVAELPSMDDQKKAVLYELGKVLEKVNRLPEAMDCFKQIYQSDIGYRDVADKVEHGYKIKPTA